MSSGHSISLRQHSIGSSQVVRPMYPIHTQAMPVQLPSTLGSDVGQSHYSHDNNLQTPVSLGLLGPTHFIPQAYSDAHNYQTPPPSTTRDQYYYPCYPSLSEASCHEIRPATQPESDIQPGSVMVRDTLLANSVQGMCNMASAVAGQAIGYGTTAVLTPLCGIPLATMTGNVVGGVVAHEMQDKICSHLPSQPMVSTNDPIILPGVHGHIVCTLGLPNPDAPYPGNQGGWASGVGSPKVQII